MMDDDTKKIFEQMKELEPIDRCTNLSLMFVGETLTLLLNAGPDQARLLLFKQSLDNLSLEASKAIVNRSANSN